MAFDIESAIAGLKQDLGVELDRDLATVLRVDPSTVAGWRRRGSIPERYRLRAARQKDEGASEGIGYTKGSTLVGLREAYIFSLIRAASLGLGEDISGRRGYDEVWAGFRLANLYEYLWKELDHTKDKDWWRQRFETLKAEMDGADDLAVWLETLR